MSLKNFSYQIEEHDSNFQSLLPVHFPFSAQSLEAFPHKMYPGLQWYVAKDPNT